MNLRKAIYFCILTAISLNNINGTERIYDLAKMGLKANSSKNASPVMQQVVNLIKTECNPGDSIILRFAKGKYFFYETDAIIRTYYISNHDQTNPKKVGIELNGFKHLTLEGNGAEFIFH